ncbi:hypothetical protein L208DRAFT_1379273 [Tricholoma matsutake]|nr:hypothetical protein L208DRAFT_1379273 [Tricholoma matsutake 945]
MAVLADKAMIVQAVADEMDGDAEEILMQEFCKICDLIYGLPAIQASDEPAKPIGQGLVTFEDLDFDALPDGGHLCEGHVDGSTVDPLPSGNAANAAAVTASALAKQVAAQRKKIFTQAKVPLLNKVFALAKSLK